MKIFVFEPFEWGYCGGAIVVIAETEQRAHELIWEKEKADHAGRYPVNCGWDIDTYEKLKNWTIEKNGAMFAPYPKIAERYMRCDRWELTHWSYVTQETKERVVTYNYNYG